MCVACFWQTTHIKQGSPLTTERLRKSVLRDDQPSVVPVGVGCLEIIRRTSICVEKGCGVAAWPCRCVVTVIVVAPVVLVLVAGYGFEVADFTPIRL